MSTVPAQAQVAEAVTTRALDAAASARVLVGAAKLQSLVYLSRAAEPGPPELEATLLACEDDALRMRLIARRGGGAAAGEVFHARLMDTPACFHFETRLLDPLPRQAPATIRASRPEVIRVEERRSAPRRHFQQETAVRLWGISGRRQQPCEGVLLNVCPGGLACRVSGAGDGSFITGTTVRVAFNPDAAPEAGELNLAARIVSVTAASQPEVVILGLEFEKESLSKAAEERIRAALSRSQ